MCLCQTQSPQPVYLLRHHLGDQTPSLHSAGALDGRPAPHHCACRRRGRCSIKPVVAGSGGIPFATPPAEEQSQPALGSANARAEQQQWPTSGCPLQPRQQAEATRPLRPQATQHVSGRANKCTHQTQPTGAADHAAVHGAGTCHGMTTSWQLPSSVPSVQKTPTSRCKGRAARQPASHRVGHAASKLRPLQHCQHTLPIASCTSLQQLPQGTRHAVCG